MKRGWSGRWVGSRQPRKQRKFRHNAPLHVRHRFLSVHLSPDLRERYGKRSLPVRNGDEVEVMRGGDKGMRGKVERVDLKKQKIYITGLVVKKSDGSEVMKPLQPSNLKAVSLTLDDKMRRAVLERAERVKAAEKAEKEGEKEGKVKEKGNGKEGMRGKLKIGLRGERKGTEKAGRKGEKKEKVKDVKAGGMEKRDVKGPEKGEKVKEKKGKTGTRKDVKKLVKKGK